MNRQEATFRRELRLFDATMLVVGSMIGSGIFIVSADIARMVGAPGYLLLVWVLTGVLTLVAALCYGELAALFPRAGGQYVYLQQAYSPLVGFLYGWALFLVIQTGSIAAVGVAFAKFTAVLIPWFSESNVVAQVAGLRINAGQLLAITSIIVLTVINLRGVRLGKLVQDTFTVTKTAALLGLIVVGLTLGLNAESIAQNWASFWEAQRLVEVGAAGWSIEPLAGVALLSAIGAAMVGSLFAADAWNNITFAAAEVVEPQRTVPRSMVLGVLVVTVLYVVANIAYLTVLPLRGVQDGATVWERGLQFALQDRVGAAAMEAVFGPWGAVLMAVFIMISTFGCNNGLILAGARVYYAMAQDGLFFRAAGRLNQHAVPGVALVLQALWASVLCLSGRYGDLLDYIVFAVLLFYIVTIAGIFVLRRKIPQAERPYRAPGYPVLPLLYILAAAAIAVDLLIVKPRYTIAGLLLVLSGVPVYLFWRWWQQRSRQ
ncbi:MAG: amino acid permease [Candidatus Kapabacteria bacterium]|nr:amino acid permease [Candidatus Kapabacteria bacterium]MCS7169776.1 amino acid permease [Candidatus Kapabacteria bacterium]MDW8224802.1 amino acid permease [Bacteroidota bacterium]